MLPKDLKEHERMRRLWFIQKVCVAPHTSVHPRHTVPFVKPARHPVGPKGHACEQDQTKCVSYLNSALRARVHLVQ